MIQQLKWVFLISMGFLALACEKVIDLELEDSATELVIEANLWAGTSTLEVLISNTASYFDSALPVTIEDATVTLSDEAGNSFNAAHLGNGRYLANITTEEGMTYRLTVEVDGIIYQADSFLPQKIELVELIAEYEAAAGPIEEGYSMRVRFNDPGGEENYYRIVHYVDGVKQIEPDDLQVVEDVLFDGGLTRLPMFQQSFDLGDSVSIELIHFDEASFAYFNSLSDIINSGGGPGGASAAPGNPTTNWSGGALGYFSASQADTLSIVIIE